MRALKPTYLLFALILGLVGCAPAVGPDRAGTSGSPRAATRPKTITAAITGAPPYLVHQFDTSTNKPGWGELEQLYNSSLTVIDSTGVVAPQLAEAAPTEDNGGWVVRADGSMETRWSIKPGVTWHDGAPLTTRDLLFTHEVSLDRALTQSIARSAALVDRAEAVDARTIVVHWKQPFIEADRYFNSMSLPSHILEPTYRADKEAFVRHPYMTSDFVGTGPFRVTHFEPGVSVKLAAFDQYVLGRPQIDEIEVRFLLDLNTLVSNVLAGEVDLTMGRGISTEQGVHAQGLWRDGRADFPEKSWLRIFGQYIDPDPTVVGDLRFHRAVMHAINRQEMVDTIQYGVISVTDMEIVPSHPYFAQFDARIPKYPYDPQRAVQLLQEAGYTRGADGVLRNAAGQRLEVEIRTTGDVDIQRKSIAAISNYLRQVGMAMTETIIPTQLAGDRLYRVSFPGLEMLRGPIGESSFLSQSMHSTRIPTPDNRYTGGNYPRYGNPQWDALVDRYSVTIPYGERMQALSDMLYLLADQLPRMPLFFDTQVVLVSNRLVNLDAHKTGQGTQGWDAHRWGVK